MGVHLLPWGAWFGGPRSTTTTPRRYPVSSEVSGNGEPGTAVGSESPHCPAQIRRATCRGGHGPRAAGVAAVGTWFPRPQCRAPCWLCSRGVARCIQCCDESKVGIRAQREDQWPGVAFVVQGVVWPLLLPMVQVSSSLGFTQWKGVRKKAVKEVTRLPVLK